jgi:hypothetical protein
MSDVAARFWEAFADTPSKDGVELLPSTLAQAGLTVIRADGIGLSAIDDRFKVPLGASSESAAAAERLQFIIGDGPCLSALRGHTEVRASEDDLSRRWPAFYDELNQQTPYRSIASLPLKITTTLDGAIDFYFTHPTAAFDVDLGAATAIADEIVDALRATSTPSIPSTRTAGVLLPGWLYSPSATDRLRTWIAAGMLMSTLRLSPPDALARLRAYAYAHQRDITDTTDAIIDGTLPLDALTL